MKRPRILTITTTAVLVCVCAGAILETAADAQPARVAARTTRVATKRADKKRHRDRRSSACRALRHGRKNRSACRSHAARNRSAGHEDHSRPHTAAVTVTPPPPAGQSLASVLATPCENTELTPEPANLAQIDTATMCLVNQERARNNEQPLQPNAQLQRAAQGHSEEMVSDDYFAHVAPSGLTPLERVRATSYIPNDQVGYTIGENLAWGTMQLSTPSAIVAAWIASPEHLANILYTPYRDTAVSVVPAVPASLGEDQPGATYSQEFGVIVE